MRIFKSGKNKPLIEMTKPSAAKAGWKRELWTRLRYLDLPQKYDKGLETFIEELIASELARERKRIAKYLVKEIEKIPKRIGNADEKWNNQEWVDYSRRETLKDVLTALTEAAKKVMGK